MEESKGSQDVIRQQIETLKKLQAVDTEIKEIEKDLQKYPAEVSLYRNELQSLREALTENKLQIEEADKSKSLLEKELSGKKESIGKTEKRLLEIKTHKEYEALQKELIEAKREYGEIEESILQLMEKAESFSSATQDLDNSFKRKQDEYNPKIEEYEKIIEELKTKHAPRQKEKDSISRQLTPELLFIYKKISKRTPKFLALASEEMCKNCNMNIPPQMFNEVLTQAKIVQCPSCNRILYCEN